MTEETERKCPRCRAKLPAADSQSLCAACVMQQAMDATSGAETMTMERGPHLALNGPDEFPFEFGDYQLICLLGRGGMGAVYEAVQRSTGRRVALKMLGQQLESAAMRQRFLREGRLAAGVTHPNSLYVYGAEEIDGVPVITMEIVESGTLSDELKRRGPLPVADAVDAALGIIAGLEAAYSVGVLHRDIKPSNIFVKPDGGVTVGDYGLSVSTVATVDSFATATGVALGTPAFAAPEQLKGAELDVRADIYSVGATLYTLLTNRAPIEGNNPVQIVAAALDEKPSSVKDLRPEVPSALAGVVAKCLAKKPEQRYADYPELRRALLPFSSEMPQPASLQRRFLAGFVDALFGWFLPGGLLCAYYGRINTVELLAAEGLVPFLALFCWHVAYMGLPEGLWGASLGKWLTGLRVVRSDGGRLGVPIGLGRASMNWLSGQGAVMAWILLMLGVLPPPETFAMSGMIYGFGQIAVLVVPFLTMRRDNGWAAMWDLGTRSRVMERARGLVRPSWTDDIPMLEDSDEGERLGPYVVVERLTPDWVLAIDPALRRRVWLRRSAAGSLGSVRRDLARPGRIRWQQSVAAADGSWEVFEAPRGDSLASLVAKGESPHWDSMRYWLYDLTIELAQAEQDQTLPDRLGLAHVWITAAGRAVILDDAWPKAELAHSTIDVSNIAGRQGFLDSVARCCMPTSVPAHARPLLASMAAGSFEKLSFVAGNLRSLLNRPARIDRSTRAASLLLLPLILVVLAIFGMAVAGPASLRAKSLVLEEMYPGLPALNDVIRFRYSVPAQDRRFIQVHLAGHYQYEDFADYDDWNRYRLLGDDGRRILREISERPPTFSPSELERADRRVTEAVPAFLERERQWNLSTSLPRGLRFAARCLLWVAALQSVTLLLGGATAGQYLFGFALVDRNGQLAQRGRLMLRWLVAWGLFLMAILGERWLGEFSTMILALWMVGVMVAIVRPERGIQDEVSGCWIVNR